MKKVNLMLMKKHFNVWLCGLQAKPHIKLDIFSTLIK